MTTNIKRPEIGEVRKCLVCAYEKPWGIYDEETGICVCKDCRDKAQIFDSGSVARDLVIGEIILERVRQINYEGWSTEHDDEHTDESLAMVAACYAAPRRIYVPDGPGEDLELSGAVDAWPFTWDDHHNKRDQHDRRRQLVIAGALIIAEIERLDRVNDRG